MKGVQMQLNIKEVSTRLVMNEWGQFTCNHKNIEVKRPCCNGYVNGVRDCECGGTYSLYCPDCSNVNLTEDQISTLMQETV